MMDKIESMLSMQDELNKAVNPKWIEVDDRWSRAIWTECAELLNELNWKWWKHEVIDFKKIHLEVVDIWHFVISDLLHFLVGDKVRACSYIASAAVATEGASHPGINKIEQLIELTESIARETLNNRVILSEVLTLIYSSGLSLEQLYRLYIGKNILNVFRQDNGYKTGGYKRKWPDGRDDNDHIYDICMSDEISCIKTELEIRYGKL